MAKFLKSIYKLQSAFGISEAEYKRTMEFGLLPTQEQLGKLESWFSQAIDVKDALYARLYKQFISSPSTFLMQERVKYETLFKGSKLLPELQQGRSLVTFDPLWEGIALVEVIGTINSYLTNHKKAFKTIISDMEKISQTLKSNLQIITFLQKDNPIYEDVVRLTTEIEEKNDELLVITYESIIKTTDDMQLFVKKLDMLENLVSSYNYSLNLLKQAYAREDLIFLNKTQLLPEFPNSRILEKKDSLEVLLGKLTKLSEKKYEAEVIWEKLQKRNQREQEKEKWLEERLGKEIKKRKFVSKLLYWVVNKDQFSSKEKVGVFFQKLDFEINKLQRQFIKNHDLSAFRQMVYLQAQKARLINPEANEKINDITSELAMVLLKGKSETEEFILPGFFWKTKPAKPGKNTALGFRDNQFILFFSNTTSDFTIGEGNISFIKTWGGGRKKNSKQKSFERIIGSFNENGSGLALPLHFGKSYARRFLTNKDWGLWLAQPGIELNNGKVKRVRRSPRDEWRYYFDLTVSSEKPFDKDFSQQVLSKAKAVIGIDRGEKYPIAYVVKDKSTGKILEEDLLGKEFITRLEEIDKKIKTYQELGNLVPLDLKNKKSHLKETSVTTLISVLLEKAAKYHAIFAIENLDRSFQGGERSLIPKKTYVAVEDSLVSALEFAGLLEKSRSKNSKNSYYGALLKVNKSGTSKICPNPKCKTEWYEKEKELIFNKLLESGVSINFATGVFSVNGEQYQLSQKFIKYNIKKRVMEERTLAMLQQSSGNKEQFKRLFLGLLGPRISQEQFICPKISCGFTKNADLVGASNIADRGIELSEKFLKKKAN